MELPYFAYGSNLNEEELRAWCRDRGFEYPFVKALSRAYLPDREPVFDFYSPPRGGGALNIVPRPGQLVPGALFQVRNGAGTEPDGWAVLDRKEGAPSAYDRSRVFVLTEDGGQVEAVTYVVRPERRETSPVPPTPEYLESVRTGYRAFGLPEANLDAVAQGRPVPCLLDMVFCYGTLMRGSPGTTC